MGVLYLTPVFPARSTHRYDASTFAHVDPLLGGDRALRKLTRAAHDRGVRVMGDLTTNHTGDAHEWFRAAHSDPGSAEAGFYFFTDHPDDYVGWLGVPSLPKSDYSSTELRRRVYGADDSVLVRWLTGPDPLDGRRIDVANMTGRHGVQDLNREVSGRSPPVCAGWTPPGTVTVRGCWPSTSTTPGPTPIATAGTG